MSVGKTRVSEGYLPVFCRELHQLVRSGIPVSEGLREDETDPKVLAWLDELCKLADEGLPLARALSETQAFPAI